MGKDRTNPRRLFALIEDGMIVDAVDADELAAAIHAAGVAAKTTGKPRHRA